jgi:hypothetical protein
MADHIIGITLERDGRTVPLHPDVERLNAEGDSTKIGLTSHPVAFLSPLARLPSSICTGLAANVRCTKAPMGNPCVCGLRASTAWKRFDRRSSGCRDPEPAHNASIAAAPPRPHRALICRVDIHRSPRGSRAPLAAQPSRLPGQAACQLPDQSTTLRVEFSSTDDSRLRAALPIGDFHRAIRSHCRL